MAEKRDSRVLKSAAWHPAFNEKHEDHIPNKLADIRYFICLSQLFSLSFSSHGLSIMIITLWSGDPWHIVWGRVTLCHAVTLYLLWHNNNQICHNKDHSYRTRVIIFRPENVFFEEEKGARNKNGALQSNVLSLVSGLKKMENSIVNLTQLSINHWDNNPLSLDTTGCRPSISIMMMIIISFDLQLQPPPCPRLPGLLSVFQGKFEKFSNFPAK